MLSYAQIILGIPPREGDDPMARDTNLADFKGSDGRTVHVKVSDTGTLFTRTGGGDWTRCPGPKPRDASEAGAMARSKHGEKK